MSEKDGHALKLLTTATKAGTVTAVRFQILDTETKRPVTEFVELQTKLMHLYMIRTDLTGFQHLHPTMAADGTWSVLASFFSGTYRVFTDFAVNHAGSPDAIVLSRTLEVAGATPTLEAVGEEVRNVTVDGYQLTLQGEAMAGKDSPLKVTVSKDSKLVTTLQTYLDSYAHVTAFHSPDLAFAHLHPEGSDVPISGKGGPTLTLMANLAEAGPYKVFVQFMHEAKLHTAVFTLHALTGASGDGMSEHSSHG